MQSGPSAERMIRTNLMTNRETVCAFIDRINAHDVTGLGRLTMIRFIDAHGNQVLESATDAGRPGGYFEWFPIALRALKSSMAFDGTCQRRADLRVVGFAGARSKESRMPFGASSQLHEAASPSDAITLWQVFAETPRFRLMR